MVIYQRDVENRRGLEAGDPIEAVRTLRAQGLQWIEESMAAGRYTRFVFAPSVDLGIYGNYTTDISLLGFYYLVARGGGADGQADEDETEHMVQLFKALADPQRVRILSLLKGRELYSMEIVERTGLHQSVVSRQLNFLRGVGLVNVRRQNNMKFFSLNTDKREGLFRAIDTVMPPATSK